MFLDNFDILILKIKIKSEKNILFYYILKLKN
jgi:hypothetical protein